MSAYSPSPRPRLSRRGFLALSAVTTGLMAAGCTSAPEEERETVTAEQADSLVAQVTAQEAVVAAYAAAAAADPTLGAEITGLAEQAGAQLDRLRAAAPGGVPSATATATAAGSPAVGPDPRAWLQEQVRTGAASHAAASAEQSGGRAALLGSVAAGLRGHAAALA